MPECRLNVVGLGRRLMPSEGANTSVSDVTVDSRFPQFPEFKFTTEKSPVFEAM